MRVYDGVSIYSSNKVIRSSVDGNNYSLVDLFAGERQGDQNSENKNRKQSGCSVGTVSQ
jgi:hypothetical protein